MAEPATSNLHVYAGLRQIGAVIPAEGGHRAIGFPRDPGRSPVELGSFLSRVAATTAVNDAWREGAHDRG